MNDDATVIGVGLQEFIPDPDQVVLPLAFELDARADARMDEEVTAFPVPKAKALEKSEMTIWQHAPEFRLGRREPHMPDHPRIRCDAIAPQGFAAAETHPGLTDPDVVQEPEHGVLVIAEEMHRLVDRKRMIQQMVDDTARVRPAVDIVAEVNQGGPRRRSSIQIIGNPGLERDQQIKAPVDVPDGVDAVAGFDQRGDLSTCT